MLKNILIGLAVIISILLIIPLFLADSYSVTRQKEIARPDSVVFKAVGDYAEFVKWSPWSERDPGATNTVTGEPFSIGYKYEWKGDPDLSGSGYMQVTGIEPNRKIMQDLVFNEPMQSTALNVWELTPTETGTLVTWTTSGELDYMGRYFGLMMDGMLGADFEHGLNNLKKYIEAR